MKLNDNILKPEEKAVYSLRELYISRGYTRFKMSKFEEYDLYSKNKDFLVSEGVITFTDTDGRLLALKPDVTLSIIKNARSLEDGTEKYYYNENVYRISHPSNTYKEIMQTGLECMGKIRREDIYEVTELALRSLERISKKYVLRLCHVGLCQSILDAANVDASIRENVICAISEKNADELKNLLDDAQFNVIKCMIKTYQTCEEAIEKIKSCCPQVSCDPSLTTLSDLCTKMHELGLCERIVIDFSIMSFDNYYSGIVFKGYVNSIPTKVLSGGQYDKLMHSFGKNCGALGFAVYLDALERLEEQENAVEDEYINIALPKGRLGEKVYDLFEAAGFECPQIKEESRKLIFENKEKKLRYFWVKPSDVAIYVERGAADIGVCGKDILLEHSPDVYELLDLNLGKCRMAVAAKNDFRIDTTRTLRVATKFSNIAKKYYQSKCQDIDIIHLNGSIEIAPILNLSDVIVDIVETGKTLLENNLSPIEDIVKISARLISNKSAYGFKTTKIEKIKKGLLAKVKKDD